MSFQRISPFEFHIHIIVNNVYQNELNFRHTIHFMKTQNYYKSRTASLLFSIIFADNLCFCVHFRPTPRAISNLKHQTRTKDHQLNNTIEHAMHFIKGTFSALSLKTRGVTCQPQGIYAHPLDVRRGRFKGLFLWSQTAENCHPLRIYIYNNIHRYIAHSIGAIKLYLATFLRRPFPPAVIRENPF